MAGDSTESAEGIGFSEDGGLLSRRVGRRVVGIKDMQSVRSVIKSIRVHDEKPNCMREG